MKEQSSIGVVPEPEGFRYDTVIKDGKPVHHGDFFSIRHPEMDHGRRAKIFAPFAALRGFEEEVASKETRYEPKRDLDPDELYELNHKLNVLYERTRNGRYARHNPVQACVEYYRVCEDPHNEAYGCKGEYITISGIVQRVDPEQQNLKIEDSVIPFSLIFRITAE
jgi:hypothetical protein